MYFYQLAYRDSKVPKYFVGLIHMQCFPSLYCNWDKQNNPTVPATPTISGFTAREMSQVLTRLHEPSICMGAMPPSNAH